MNCVGWLFNRSTCRSSHCRCSGLVWSERITGWRSSVKYSFLFVSGSLFLCVFLCVCVCVWVGESERDSITVNTCQTVCVWPCVSYLRQCLFYFFIVSLSLCVCVCLKRQNYTPLSPHPSLLTSYYLKVKIHPSLPAESHRTPPRVTSLLALIYPHIPLIPWRIHTSV